MRTNWKGYVYPVIKNTVTSHYSVPRQTGNLKQTHINVETCSVTDAIEGPSGKEFNGARTLKIHRKMIAQLDSYFVLLPSATSPAQSLVLKKKILK